MVVWFGMCGMVWWYGVIWKILVDFVLFLTILDDGGEGGGGGGRIEGL